MQTQEIRKGEYVVGTTQLGKELGISRVAAFKRIESGSCKAFLVGNQYLIPWSQVIKLRKIISPTEELRTVRKNVLASKKK